MKETKVCRVCKKEKDLSQFRSTYKMNLQGVIPLRSLCSKCEIENAKKYFTKNPVSYLLKKANDNARLKNLEFNLTKEDIIIPEYCPILNIKLKGRTSGSTRPKNAITIDRIDSSKGYIKGNIKVISLMANIMKSDATKEQLLTFAKNIKKYLEDDIV